VPLLLAVAATAAAARARRALDETKRDNSGAIGVVPVGFFFFLVIVLTEA
jgi:hypothetical protein